MSPMQKNLLRRAACAAVAIGAAGAARADAFAQSILVIDDLRLLHANGTAYSAAEFPQLAGSANAFASGQLNGTFGSATLGVDRIGVGLDIAHQNAAPAWPRARRTISRRRPRPRVAATATATSAWPAASSAPPPAPPCSRRPAPTPRWPPAAAHWASAACRSRRHSASRSAPANT